MILLNFPAPRTMSGFGPADLTAVQSAADRKNACDDAIAVQTDAAYVAARQAAQQTERQIAFSCAIQYWCNLSSNVDVQTTTSSRVFPMNMLVDTAVLDGWESDLTGQGYIVTRDGPNFTVALPPP